MADFDLAAAGELSTTQLYPDENGLRIMLNTIGIRVRERNHIISDGYSSMSEIINLHKDDIDGFERYLIGLNKTFAASRNDALRIYFTPVTISRLVGVVHYFNCAINNFHQIPDLLMVDEDDATIYANHYRSLVKAAEDDPELISLPQLTGSSNWIDFRDKFIMRLSNVKGCRNTTLHYVIDSTPRAASRATSNKAEVNTIDIMNDSIFHTTTTHFGRAYKVDNKAVWDTLKSNLLGRPPYNHVSRYDTSSDGRSAWETLRSFYEGVDFQERMRETAFAKLTSTFYKGESHRFSFEKYIEVHKTAHKMLEDCGYNNNNGMDDATKIQHFKSGIKQDAGLENALLHTRANPHLRTFDGLISFLSAEVDHRNVRRKQLNSTRDRRVSGAGTKPHGKGNKNNNGNDQRPSKVVDGLTVYAKSYPKAEFRRMTKAQREAVVELHRARRQRNNKAGSDKPPHNVSAATINNLRDDLISMGDAIIAGVSKATGEDVSVITNTNSPQDDHSTSSSKRKTAESGQCGDFIRQRRQRRSGN